jgi:hypothetical protein
LLHQSQAGPLLHQRQAGPLLHQRQAGPLLRQCQAGPEDQRGQAGPEDQRGPEVPSLLVDPSHLATLPGRAPRPLLEDLGPREAPARPGGQQGPRVQQGLRRPEDRAAPSRPPRPLVLGAPGAPGLLGRQGGPPGPRGHGPRSAQVSGVLPPARSAGRAAHAARRSAPGWRGLGRPTAAGPPRGIGRSSVNGRQGSALGPRPTRTARQEQRSWSSERPRPSVASCEHRQGHGGEYRNGCNGCRDQPPPGGGLAILQILHSGLRFSPSRRQLRRERRDGVL